MTMTMTMTSKLRKHNIEEGYATPLTPHATAGGATQTRSEAAMPGSARCGRFRSMHRMRRGRRRARRCGGSARPGDTRPRRARTRPQRAAAACVPPARCRGAHCPPSRPPSPNMPAKTVFFIDCVLFGGFSPSPTVSVVNKSSRRLNKERPASIPSAGKLATGLNGSGVAHGIMFDTQLRLYRGRAAHTPIRQTRSLSVA